jgi:copper(I)-binding protein
MLRSLSLRRALALLALGLAACGDPLLERVASRTVTTGDLAVHTIYALVPFRDSPLPVYFTVRNVGTTSDTLLGATSSASASVMLHGSGAMDAAGSLVVPPSGELILAPGGTHLMLEPPLPPFARGDSVEVTLRFAQAGEVQLWVPIIGYEDVERSTPPPRSPR